jgi:hypothetical protein
MVMVMVLVMALAMAMAMALVLAMAMAMALVLVMVMVMVMIMVTKVKELKNMTMTENESREFLVDFLNGELKEKELLNIFEIYQCPICENFILDEEKVYHTWDIGEYEEEICEQCRINEEE